MADIYHEFVIPAPPSRVFVAVSSPTGLDSGWTKPAICAGWGGYLAIDPGTRVIVGTCSYKGPPDAQGAAEIAYHTFEPYEVRGYATAMASALREQARATGESRTVRAHTLVAPSQGVLT
jgi:RimJ/RimL family protein N-acetyltransferase